MGSQRRSTPSFTSGHNPFATRIHVAVPPKRPAKKAEHLPKSAILKKRGLGYGSKIPPIHFRVSGDQIAELEQDVATAKKAGEAISVNEAARRRCFPDGPKLIRVRVVLGQEVDIEALSLYEVLKASPIRKYSENPTFRRWLQWTGVWERPGQFLVAELGSDAHLIVARVIQGALRGLPVWRGK